MGTVDLNRLPAFISVAETGSFSAAAARLRMPKSSVSRQVAALERELGVQLFHRTTRRVALSTAGIALRDQVSPSLAALEAAVGAVPERQDEPSGVLRIAAPADIGTAILAPIAARYAIRYPRVVLDLRLSSATVDLVGEGFDLALRVAMTPMRDSALVGRRVSPIEVGLFASPSYVARCGTPGAPAELVDHRWIAFHGTPHLRLRSAGRTVTVRVVDALICDDLFVLREIVRSGAGVGALPSFLADRDVLDGALVPVLPRWCTPTGALWLVRPGAAHVPRKVLAFEELVRATLAR